ncbi:MAG: SurA N-terminal domain-containing protein [Alysiella sp.]|uniref:SurA N-terminal domain-containing protein n=1 Tax=Alysiella sp. TaxID=1872483 RepID=UPI0026DCF275|nr:SurA N-terminal domain-containing protein [Alysiella sp.]MDO4433358.1 SurA N-terminal domain-containing protein [Alysiella sp.]
MFHAIEKFRLPAQILLGTIAISFIGFGVTGFDFSANSRYIIKVGEQTITRADLDQAIRQAQVRGGNTNREAVFKTLLDQAYLLEGAKNLGVVISDTQIKQSIVDNPLFHDEAGKFDVNKFQTFLKHNGLNEQNFMNEERTRLTQIALLVSLSSTPAADTQAQQLLNIERAVRTIRSVPISPESFANKVSLNDDAIKKYYESHKANYALEQAVKFEYVRLSPQDLAAKENVSDEELKKAFEEQQNSFKSKRRLAHILFEVSKSADASQREQARAAAEKTAAELKKQPEKFAEFAQKYSQDTSSSSNGGDLGHYTQDGSLGSKTLEDAAFALKEGEISNVIESDFGYHIVRASEIQATDFESQKASLRQNLQEKKAQQTYNKLREAFGDDAFANNNSLKTAADKHGQSIQTQNEWLTRSNSGSLKVPQAVVEALFSEDVFTQKHNSEGIVADGATWFVRATETRAAGSQAFDDIKGQVRSDYLHNESTRLAKEAAEKMLADLHAGKKVTLAWSPQENVTPMQMRQVLPAHAYQILMATMPKNGQPAYALLDTPTAPQLIEVLAVHNPQADAKLLNEARQAVSQINGNSLIEAYLNSLRAQIKTKEGAERINDNE